MKFDAWAILFGGLLVLIVATGELIYTGRTNTFLVVLSAFTTVIGTAMVFSRRGGTIDRKR